MRQRIGYGSYERPNREQSKEDLRNGFLEAVNIYARHVLDDLYDEPFRLYLESGLAFNTDSYTDDLDADELARKRAREWTRHLWNRPEWQRKFEAGPIAYDARKENYRQSVFEWSSRHNLNAAWCRECAYNTHDIWAYSRPDRKHLQFQPLVKVITFFQTGRPEKWFRLPEGLYLHPQLCSLEAIEAELQSQVRAFIRDLEARAKAKGYVRTPKKNKSAYHKDYDRWLVERVINRKSIQAIARESKTRGDKGDKHDKGGPDNKTVRDAVKKLAESIELSLPLA